MNNIKIEEIILEVCREFLESNKPIALPGGTWCVFCKKEICRNPEKHYNGYKLNLFMGRNLRIITTQYMEEEKKFILKNIKQELRRKFKTIKYRCPDCVKVDKQYKCYEWHLVHKTINEVCNGRKQ